MAELSIRETIGDFLIICETEGTSLDAVSVNNVSICYITGDVKSIGVKEVILKKLRGEYHIEKFWANQNISFSIDRGDMLGSIGKNGAGKSTLLKAVSGVLVPTEGKISVKGNIAALLELTAGFDGNLTVRENSERHFNFCAVVFWIFCVRELNQKFMEGWRTDFLSAFSCFYILCYDEASFFENRDVSGYRRLRKIKKFRDFIDVQRLFFNECKNLNSRLGSQCF